MHVHTQSQRRIDAFLVPMNGDDRVAVIRSRRIHEAVMGLTNNQSTVEVHPTTAGVRRRKPKKNTVENEEDEMVNEPPKKRSKKG